MADSDQLEGLKRARAEARTRERERLPQVGHGSSWKVRLLKFGRTRKALYLGVALVALAVVGSASWQLVKFFTPDWKLDSYEGKIAAGNLGEAELDLAAYLELRPDDLFRSMEYALLLVRLDRYTEAGDIFLALIDAGDFALDNEVQFYNTILNKMPLNRSTTEKMDVILIDLKSFIPALVVRGIINLEEFPEPAIKDLTEAAEWATQMSEDQEDYSRYRRMIIDFLVLTCSRYPDIMNHRLVADPENFPMLYSGSGLYLYGADISFSTNPCGTYKDRERIDPDVNLRALLYLLKSLGGLYTGDFRLAEKAIGSSRASGQINELAFLEGNLLIANSDISGALSIWQRMGTELDPVVYASMGTAELMMGPADWERALESYNRSLQIEPNNATVLNNRGVLHIIAGRDGQAKNDLLSALEIRQGYYPNAVYNLGVIHLNFEDEAAQAVVDFGLQISNEDIFPGTYYWLYKAQAATGNRIVGLDTLRRATRSRFFAQIANIELGDFYSGSELSWDLAEEHYRRAYYENPRGVIAGLKLANLISRLGRDDEAFLLVDEIAPLVEQGNKRLEAEVRATRGELYYRRGDFIEARDQFKKAYDLDTVSDLRVRMAPSFARSLFALGLNWDALEMTRTLLPLAPDNLPLIIVRAYALAAANDMDQALRAIKWAEDLEPNNYDLFLAKGDILAQFQRWNEALLSYEIAFDIVPTNAEPMEKSVAILEKIAGPDSKRLAEAQNQLKRLRRLQEQRAQMEYLEEDRETSEHQRITLERSLSSDEAIATTRREIDRLTGFINSGQIDRYTGLLNRGGMHAQVGELEESVRDFELAAAEFPDKYLPFSNLGHLYIATQNYEGADKAYTQAIEKEAPNPEKLYFLRAKVRKELGRNDGARADYEKVMKLLPNFVPVYMNRGLLFMSEGKYEEAIKDFTQIIKIDPKNLGAYRERHRAFHITGQAQKSAADAEIISILKDQ